MFTINGYAQLIPPTADVRICPLKPVILTVSLVSVLMILRLCMTVEHTALGLELDTTDESYDIVQPIEVFVVVKGLDSKESLVYWTLKSPTLANVEAMGMAMWGYEVAKDSA